MVPIMASKLTPAFFRLVYDAARSRDSPVILELGTQRGQQPGRTKVFLAACEETGGTLVSIDIKDCSNVSDAPNFILVQSDSIAVANIVKQAPILSQGIHMVFVDTVRVRAHLEKEVAGWWPFIKSEGWLFCRGVDPGPYRRGSYKDAIVLEKESEERARMEFFLANPDSCDLAIHYGSTGLAVLRKWSAIGTPSNPPVSLPGRPIGSLALYATRKARRRLLSLVSGRPRWTNKFRAWSELRHGVGDEPKPA